MNYDAGDARVGVGRFDFVGDFCDVFSVKIFYICSDVLAVFDFEVDIFHNDWVTRIADDEEPWLMFHGTDLMSLTLFNEAS